MPVIRKTVNYKDSNIIDSQIVINFSLITKGSFMELPQPAITHKYVEQGASGPLDEKPWCHNTAINKIMDILLKLFCHTLILLFSHLTYTQRLREHNNVILHLQ